MKKSVGRSPVRQKAPATKVKVVAPKAVIRVAKAAAAKAINAKPLRQRAPSKSGGLNASQLKELSARLKSLKLELKATLDEKAGAIVQADSESLIKGDDAEVAEKQRANNAALQEIDILKNRLAMIERALQKIAMGVYGLCEETEEPIGYERLSVVPWARYSVRVQEVRERRLRDFKVSRLRSEA